MTATVVDAQGLPIRLGPIDGQTHDGQIADALLDHIGPSTIVLADKAYDADGIRELIQDRRATPNIPRNYEMGRRAVELLIEIATRGARAPAATIRVDGPLVERGSVAAPGAVGR